MKKRLFIAWVGIPATIVTTVVIALTTNIAGAPFDYIRSLFAQSDLGREVHVTTPIGGVVISRTATGTNVQLFDK
jgi:hypothetical protein